MRRRDELMLDEVHRLLAEIGPARAVTVAKELVRRGFGRRAPSTVDGWLAQLVRDGRIDGEHRLKIPPLYPAYLLLDLPERRHPDVRRVLEARGRDFEIETVTGVANTTMIRLSCREAELATLRDECLANGAIDAKALLVLSRERRSA
jgi:hypothetical protein